MKLRSTLMLGVAALLPLAASAGEGYDKAGKSAKALTFDTLDANRDGRISQTEAAVDSKIVFATTDTNGDGYIDKSEWKARMKGSASPAPQTEPVTPTDPSMPQTAGASGKTQPDVETPRQ